MTKTETIWACIKAHASDLWDNEFVQLVTVLVAFALLVPVALTVVGILFLVDFLMDVCGGISDGIGDLKAQYRRDKALKEEGSR